MQQDFKPEVDIEWEAEKICRWGAARAGVIVAAPLVGTMALMANEVYMIMRLGELRGVKLDEGAVLGLLGSLGATFAGQTLATLIPFAPVQIPLGISVTYAAGKAANAWLKAGRPEDIAVFREVYDKARTESMEHLDEFKNMDCRNKALGDESKKFNLESEEVFGKFINQADKLESNISQKLKSWHDEWVKPLVKKGENWLDVQQWQNLKNGEVVIPYSEITAFIDSNLKSEKLTLHSLAYAESGRLLLTASHEEHGLITLCLSIQKFCISKEKALAELRIEDFSVADNVLAAKTVQFLGSHIILAVTDFLFEKIELEAENVKTCYAKRVLQVDFTEAAVQSSLMQKKVMGRTILDLLEAESLEPCEQGLKLKVKILK